MRNYTNYNSNKYNSYAPKKPVKNFTDLEVYQKALEGSVFVANELINFWREEHKKAGYQEISTPQILRRAPRIMTH